MKSRKLSSRDKALIERRQAYEYAPQISELHPSVSSITITTCYQEQPELPESKRNTQTFTHASKAYFIIPCRSIECIGGGYNLDQLVASTIKEGKKANAGQLVCQGWQDRDRVGQHRCFDTLKVQIDIAYR